MKVIKTPDSSNISMLAYDEIKKELTVTFTKGGVYLYKGVPEEVFIMISQAESVGSAFYKIVKQGGYEYEKLGKNTDTMRI